MPGVRIVFTLTSNPSGVGTAAIQLCQQFGNPCFVTAGPDEKILRCIEMGATAGCNRRSANFVELVPEWTNNQGIKVILDPVGGSYLADNVTCLALEGRLVIIGLMGGKSAEL